MQTHFAIKTIIFSQDALEHGKAVPDMMRMEKIRGMRK
jgi:hypothetical protein